MINCRPEFFKRALLRSIYGIEKSNRKYTQITPKYKLAKIKQSKIMYRLSSICTYKKKLMQEQKINDKNFSFYKWNIVNSNL